MISGYDQWKTASPYDDDHNPGYWHIFKNESDPIAKTYEERYLGLIDAFDGPDDFGDDIYEAAWEADLIPDVNEIEFAEADGAADVILQYKDGSFYHLIHSYDDLENDGPSDHIDCYRSVQVGETGWQCWSDETGCLYNDGHNSCSHEGYSLTPLMDNTNLNPAIEGEGCMHIDDITSEI